MKCDKCIDKYCYCSYYSQTLEEISQTWTAMEFSCQNHKRVEIPLIKPNEQLPVTLDNNQIRN